MVGASVAVADIRRVRLAISAGVRRRHRRGTVKDQIDQLLSLYERRELSRRGVVEAVAALCAAAGAVGPASAQPSSAPLVKARTFNHVSLMTKDLARSKAFYSRLTGLPVRSEAPGNFCEFRLENGFLGLYSQTFMDSI